MALILLTAAELGQQYDFVLNTDQMLYASRERVDDKTLDWVLFIAFAITIENPPIGAAPLDQLVVQVFKNCPDPDAVLRRISLAT